MINCSETKPSKVLSFIVIIKTLTDSKTNVIQGIKFDGDHKSYFYASDDYQMEVAFTLRNGKANELNSIFRKDCMELLLGDDAEWKDSLGQKSMANAVFIELHLNKKHVRIMSSIVGLPPIFIYKGIGMTILTSDLYILPMIPGLKLYFDPKGISDLCSIGHPVCYRTLFKDVSMMPAGHSLILNIDNKVVIERTWNLPKDKNLKDWDTFTELQIEAFKRAMQDIDLSESFLSLTSGLDTRTILAVLTQNKTSLPAYTMSGKTTSLDARTARNLSKAYGMRHKVIDIDDDFYRGLPSFVSEACRLSGGLASLEQAHEVYFYKNIAGFKSARLSGNLGNQVGRRGTEKISMRNADVLILNEQLIKSDEQLSMNHWYTIAQLNDGSLDYTFLLQNEVPFSSVANYSIGNHFAVQQSPYANRLLIETSQRAPIEEKRKESLSLTRMRLRDLRHRFLGESELHSFQVKLIKETGGYVAFYPINWGWRAKGGTSLTGLIIGGLAFVDAIVASKGLDSGLIYKGLEAIHVAGLHEYKQLRLWVKVFMREFIHDTLLSTSIMQSGIFNEKRLMTMIEDHCSGKKCHLKALILALDIALAKKIFMADLQ